MDTDSPKPSIGQQVKAALAEAGRNRPRPQPRPEFVAYVNTLDAMELHIARYLLHELKISSFVIPTLLPMIDQRWFIDRLESEVSFTLKELEDLEKGE
jgi:hypothetical protein